MAVLLADDMPRERIAVQLGLTVQDVRAATGRLERIANRIQNDRERESL